MELELNGIKLRVYEDGKIERFGKKMWNSQAFTWYELKGTININKYGYQRHHTIINKKYFITSRIIYFAFNPSWEIHNSSQNNSIDHINRDSLDNRISNLRVFTAAEQAQNRDFVINAKGYSLHKKSGKWQSHIKINGKKIHLGLFDTEQEAHQAYLTAKLNRV